MVMFATVGLDVPRKNVHAKEMASYVEHGVILGDHV